MIDAPAAEATTAAPAATTTTAAPAAPAPTPTATPQSSALGMDYSEPAKADAPADAPANGDAAPADAATPKVEDAPAAKTEETPADTPGDEGETEYVKASDYDAQKALLDKYLEKYGELPADTAPDASAEPAAKTEAEPRKPLELNPEMIMAAEDVTDEDLELLGWDSTTEEGQAQRANAAKFGSKIASRAAEYAEAAATAKFKASMAEDIAIQVAVHYAHQGVASALLAKHPDLGTKENFPKVVKAIQQATGELGMNAPIDGVAAKAKQLIDEGQRTVERFKSQGGKVISGASTGPGTTPRGSSQAPTAPAQRQNGGHGPGSILGG
jgi:hypothetical protein